VICDLRGTNWPKDGTRRFPPAVVAQEKAKAFQGKKVNGQFVELSRNESYGARHESATSPITLVMRATA
jgi:hypothetical protein